jgi:hypothetical protein
MSFAAGAARDSPGWWARATGWLRPEPPAPLHEALRSLPQASGWVGPAVDPEALRGKVTLLSFFVHDCEHSAALLRDAERLHRALAREGLVVVGVHEPAFGGDVSEEVRDAARQWGLTFPVALDARSAVWDAFKNRFWPAVYLVGRDGALRHVHFGDDHPERLEAKVRGLLTPP